MKQTTKMPNNKKEDQTIDIEKKINRLQKQNEAETNAFKKILDGLNRIAHDKSKIKTSEKNSNK